MAGVLSSSCLCYPTTNKFPPSSLPSSITFPPLFLPCWSLSHLTRNTHFSGCGLYTSLASKQIPIKASKKIRLCSIDVEEERKQGETKKKKKTITPLVRIAERKLLVNNCTILTDVPENIIPASSGTSSPAEGIFVGAVLSESSCRHVVPLGNLRDVRFLACFRFKIWWMSQMMGDQGRDVPLETQFLLVEAKEGSNLKSEDGNVDNPIIYTVFLPLLQGPFRACLQGNPQDQLELCLESGDIDTKASSFTHSLLISAGTDPFITINKAIAAVKSHLKTFRLRHEKKLPSIVDYFGWCTWDAFYQDVTQEGVESGLESLTAGGTSPKFVIIDDGWQSVGKDRQLEKKKGQVGADLEQQPLFRLTDIKENDKFKIKDDPAIGIKNIVRIAKNKYGLKYVYVWHAITGYWGGVRPGEEGMEEYGSKIQYPQISPGVEAQHPFESMDPLTSQSSQGLGLMDPKKVDQFYDELHGYLASAGVDGVKVDGQCILETLGAGLGGRVQLTRLYHQALDASVAKNFPDNGCIDCMCHGTDALYVSKQTAVARASDDFFPKESESHTIHIASVAYNSFFLGEILQPDWDMFHSLHPAAEYHASARAISGGPIYVSDAPGKHNFELLKKIVLPDGSILRARLPGRPTQDCLFSDPSRDGVSLLKIWNMNKYTGVLGVYNCQGAAWSIVEKKNAFLKTKDEALSCLVRGLDVHLLAEAATSPDWNGDCVVYRHNEGDLVHLPNNVALPVSLKILEHEIFTVSPVKVLAPAFSFAPLGLINMYNAGGAIQDLTYQVGDYTAISEKSSDASGKIFMDVKGCGKFGAYSSVKPRKCFLGSNPVEFSYDPSCGLVTIHLDSMPESDKKIHSVVVEV